MWWQLAERRARAADASLAEARSRAAQVDSLQARIATLGDSLRAEWGRGPASLPPTDDLDELKSLGLTDPARQILEDLVRHPELIPYRGLDGGMMGFHPGSCAVVSREWAYGYFEDGHVAGRGLFEYHVSPGGRITWKRVVAKLE